MEKKNLVYTIDNNYLVPFLVSTYSAKLQFGSNLKISIVQPIRAESGMGLSNKALDLCSSCLQYLEIDFEIVRVNTESYPEDKLPVWARFPKTTWLRYYYIYNGDFSGKYIHYVEADMLFTKNRPDIFEVELQGRAVAARTSPGHEVFEKKWGPNLSNPWYFNCGVMIIDIKLWRSQVMQGDWWNLISNYKKKGFEVIEQDALNYAFRGNYTPLTPSLNTYPSEFNSTDTALLHFAGKYKPWNYRPKLLRFGLAKNVRDSMKYWDLIESENLNILRQKLSKKEFKSLKKYYPKVRLSTKTSIFFPRITLKIFTLLSIFRKCNRNRITIEN